MRTRVWEPWLRQPGWFPQNIDKELWKLERKKNLKKLLYNAGIFAALITTLLGWVYLFWDSSSEGNNSGGEKIENSN